MSLQLSHCPGQTTGKRGHSKEAETSDESGLSSSDIAESSKDDEEA